MTHFKEEIRGIIEDAKDDLRRSRHVMGFLENAPGGKLVLTGEPHRIEVVLRDTTIPHVRINWDAMSPEQQTAALQLVVDTVFPIPVVIAATAGGAQTIPTPIRNKLTNLEA